MPTLLLMNGIFFTRGNLLCSIHQSSTIVVLFSGELWCSSKSIQRRESLQRKIGQTPMYREHFASRKAIYSDRNMFAPPSGPHLRKYRSDLFNEKKLCPICCKVASFHTGGCILLEPHFHIPSFQRVMPVSYATRLKGCSSVSLPGRVVDTWPKAFSFKWHAGKLVRSQYLDPIS